MIYKFYNCKVLSEFVQQFSREKAPNMHPSSQTLHFYNISVRAPGRFAGGVGSSPDTFKFLYDFQLSNMSINQIFFTLQNIAEEKKGVVYAELALGEQNAEKPPPPSTEYAEIVYTEQTPKETKE